MRPIHESKRWKQTGRGAGHSFIQIPHFVLNSDQFAALPPNAVKLLFELARQYRGKNNGDLSAVFDQLKPRGWTSETTLAKHLKHLEQTGWILRTRLGGKYLGCSLYAITFWPIDDCNGKHAYQAERKPSHLWKNANIPPENGAHSLQKLERDASKLQNLGDETVPIRPAA